MKKSIFTPMILIITVLLIILSGCNKKKSVIKVPDKDPIKSTEDVVEEDVNRDKIMKEFNNTLEGKNSPDKIVAFIDEKIGKLSPIEGDKMVSELERVLEKSLGLQIDNISKLDTDGELVQISQELFFPEDKVKDIKNDKLHEEIIKILDSKYKLISIEGNYYPIIDYEKLKIYNNHVSDELKEYITIKALDSNKPVAIDAGLHITRDELSQRILKTENFIQKYSGGQRHEEMLQDYRNKLNIYLSGMDNAPIADRETHKIYDDVLDSYKKTADTKESITAFAMRKYIDVIKENEYIINDKVKEKVLSLINESLSLLEASK